MTITPEQLAALLTRTQRDTATTLTGTIGQAGSVLTVQLDEPYKGSRTLTGVKGINTTRPGKVACFFIEGEGWIAVGRQSEPVDKPLISERRGREVPKTSGGSQIAYVYTIEEPGSLGVVCNPDTPTPSDPNDWDEPWEPVPPGSPPGVYSAIVTRLGSTSYSESSAYNLGVIIKTASTTGSGVIGTPAIFEGDKIEVRTINNGSQTIVRLGLVRATNPDFLIELDSIRGNDLLYLSPPEITFRDYILTTFRASTSIEILKDGAPTSPPNPNPNTDPPGTPGDPRDQTKLVYKLGGLSDEPITLIELSAKTAVGRPEILFPEEGRAIVVLRYGKSINDGDTTIGKLVGRCKYHVFDVRVDTPVAEQVFEWEEAPAQVQSFLDSVYPDGVFNRYLSYHYDPYEVSTDYVESLVGEGVLTSDYVGADSAGTKEGFWLHRHARGLKSEGGENVVAMVDPYDGQPPVSSERPWYLAVEQLYDQAKIVNLRTEPAEVTLRRLTQNGSSATEESAEVVEVAAANEFDIPADKFKVLTIAAGFFQ